MLGTINRVKDIQNVIKKRDERRQGEIRRKGFR